MASSFELLSHEQMKEMKITERVEYFKMINSATRKAKEKIQESKKTKQTKKEQEIHTIREYIISMMPEFINKMATNLYEKGNKDETENKDEKKQETENKEQKGEDDEQGKRENKEQHKEQNKEENKEENKRQNRRGEETKTEREGEPVKEQEEKIFFSDEPHLIQGLCQGGKTNYIMGGAILAYLNFGRSLVILRNSTCDKKQLVERFNDFLKQIFKKLSIKEVSIPIIEETSLNEKGIHIVLGNETVRKYEVWPNKSFTMFLDEADFLDTGDSSRTNVIDILKAKSHGYFLVSATVLDCMAKEFMMPKNIIYIPKHPNYKGLLTFDYKIEISENAKYVGKAEGDFFIADDSLHAFCSYFKDLKPIILLEKTLNKDYIVPHICLLNYSHLKKPMMSALQTIKTTYPSIFVMIQTADGITWSHKGSKPVVDTKSSLSGFLQKLKNSDMRSNIIIIAGDLASRGMSYVSTDYGWHLTHNRLLGPDSRLMPEWIQAASRLAGIFKDNYPLLMCLRASDKEKIFKAHLIQEEILYSLDQQKDIGDDSCKDLIENDIFTKIKIPKNLTREKGALRLNSCEEIVGMPIEVYEGKELPPSEYYSMRAGDECPDSVEREKYRQKKREEEQDKKKWNKEWLGEEDSKEEKVEEGDCFLVKNIKQGWKKYYNAIVDIIASEYGTGIFIPRDEILKKTNFIYQTIAGETTKMVQESVKCKENANGLVFKKEGKYWSIKLN